MPAARRRASNRPDCLDPAGLERARRALCRRDRRLAAVIREAGPCTLPLRNDPYRQLVRSVLFQQLAGAAARTIDGRLQARFGGRYPRPAELLAARDRDLRGVGLSRQKAAALRSIAAHFDDGRVTTRKLRARSDDEVVELVTQIRGVGEWTAHMLLMFGLGRPDVLPHGDYGVRKGAQLVYGLRALPDKARLERIAGPWAPYRSVASWYLWRATEIIAP